MKLLTTLFMFLGAISNGHGETFPAEYHEMQHGFILSADDKFGSHLVATGHHSRQTAIVGQLSIEDQSEYELYIKRKSMNTKGSSYFLFQAQNIDLPSLKAGQILVGHIVESKTGKYESKNIIVKNSKFAINRVMLNIENPFFGDQ